MVIARMVILFFVCMCSKIVSGISNMKEKQNEIGLEETDDDQELLEEELKAAIKKNLQSYVIKKMLKKLIDEEFHRGAESAKSLDQLKSGTFKKGLYFLGSKPTYPHSGYGLGYGPIGPDNIGYFHQYDSKTSYGGDHAYGGVVPSYEHLPSPGGGLSYGHSGLGGLGGISPYDHNGGGASYGHSGGSIYDHGVGYDHGGIYDHGYGTYEHGGDYHHSDEITGIGEYLKKKLSLKKIILPLAGIALIAAAGALSSTNPILLQLGTIGSTTGRGKRSVIINDSKKIYPLNPFVKPWHK